MVGPWLLERRVRWPRAPRRGIAGGDLLEVAVLLASGEELVLDALQLLEALLELALLQAGALGALVGGGSQGVELCLAVPQLGGERLQGLHALAHDLQLTLAAGELDDHGLQLLDARLEQGRSPDHWTSRGVVLGSCGGGFRTPHGRGGARGLRLGDPFPGVSEVALGGAELLGGGSSWAIRSELGLMVGGRGGLASSLRAVALAQLSLSISSGGGAARWPELGGAAEVDFSRASRSRREASSSWWSSLRGDRLERFESALELALDDAGLGGRSRAC